MSLEPGLSALGPLEWELAGLRLHLTPDGDEGLDDLSETETEDQESAGDGDDAGDQRLQPRSIILKVKVQPAGGWTGTPGNATEFAEALSALRRAAAPYPDRFRTRLLRFRRAGEPAKRIAVLPQDPRPLTLPGDQRRLAGGITEATIRLLGPKPTILSDELHSHTFTGGETIELTNAGDFCAVRPSAWSLTAPGPVVVEHLDHDEYVSFPEGPVTVGTDWSVDAGDAGQDVYYGPGDSWFTQWPLLRPGVNRIRCSAPATIYWRDTW